MYNFIMGINCIFFRLCACRHHTCQDESFENDQDVQEISHNTLKNSSADYPFF